MSQQRETQLVAQQPLKRAFYQFSRVSELLRVIGAMSKQFRDRRSRLKIDSPPDGTRARYGSASRRRVHLSLSAFHYKRPTNAAITTCGLVAGTEIGFHRPNYRLASRLHSVPL